MADSSTSAPQARLYVGMGGSGIKTLAEFVSLLTQHSQESKKSELFMAYLLVDTDGGDLDKYAKQISDAYDHVHREPIIRTVHLSADITDFASFVATKLKKGGHHERLKDVWWYRSDRTDEPFTALNLKDSPTKGAGQCPLVSTFLAWNQMRQIDATIDDLLNTLKNRSVQGENLQNWTLDVSLVSGLSGGTGRGCWHLVASKIREKLRDLNMRPKPVGFFFDASIMAEDVKREEQVMKLRVNSITGVSELVAWLRNEYERDTDLTPFRFRLPSLEHPDVPSSDLIDTAKLSSTVSGEELQGVSGRAPISAAYLIFGAGKQGTLGEASAYYRSVANALYARLFSSTASKNINESGHLNGLAAATISVSIAGIQKYVREYVRQFLPARFSAPLEKSKVDQVTDAFLERLCVPDVVTQIGNSDATNPPQRIYHKIIVDGIDGKKRVLEENLKDREYEDAEAVAKDITNWPDEHEDEIAQLVQKDVATQLWGIPDNADNSSMGGALRTKFDIQYKLTKEEYHRIYGESEEIRIVNPISEAARRLLGESAVKLQSEDRCQQLDLSSYGTKHAIAEQLIERLRAIAGKLTERSMPDSSQDLRSPADELVRARTGFLKTGVTEEEADGVLAAVERWVVLKSNDAIRKHLGGLLYKAADDITALDQAFQAVSGSLEKIAEKQRESTERCKDNNFWNDKDFDRVLEAGRSSFDQEILSAQTLQAVANDEALEEKFESLMTKESTAGFVEARSRFIDATQHWIKEKSDSADARLDRKLPDILDENLKAMVDQFALPDDFYAENYGFFRTVEGLMRAWGNKMIDRMGSPQDKSKLSSFFRNQFGIDYPESKAGGPKLLDESELEKFTFDVCRAMAIRLGGRCDPLFQQRFDEGERPTYDNVAVVLPTERNFDKPFADETERDAKGNPQFAAAGQFSVVPTFGTLDAGNPYTMFAYATQQFEDWRSDAGMARIASLEYYKTPAVLNWLRACEDPSGASVFLDSKELERFGISSCRDIYGLGFISPLFVQNETLKELRWSPWDMSKARSKDKKNERLDLLAYALLKPLPSDVAKHFESSAKHLGAILKKAEWSMPLLSWREEKSVDAVPRWYFTRPAIRHCTEVTAKLKRDANHPAFAKDDGYPSIRRCIDDLLTNDAIAAAIAGEAAIFMTEVLCNNDYADEFDPTQDIKVAFNYLRDELSKARAQQDGPAAEKMKKLIGELLARVSELEKYSPERLKEHFEKIRRNSELQTRA